MRLSPGSRVGPYEVRSLVGSGGMGEVYRAHDPRLGRDVALKVLLASVATDPERLRRFEHEARAAAALNHPNILAVYDVGSHEGSLYIVSELLEGETLRERLRLGGLPVRVALEVAIPLARALAVAHSRGVVHRDLKPENVFLSSDGDVKVLDFGLAKLRPSTVAQLASESPTAMRSTAAGVVLGTVAYMSPEQVRGQTTDARSDIFSFGVLLYEMLAGRRPFGGETGADVIAAILNQEPLDLGVSDVPPPLARIARRCLEKRPGDRFQTASDLVFALGLPAHVEDHVLGRPEALAYQHRVGRLSGTRSPVRFTIEVGDSGVRHGEISVGEGREFPGLLALCPNGTCIVYRTEESGVAGLHLRQFDRLDSQPLPGTENAYAPFFSPDGRWIGFFAEGYLKTLALEGLTLRSVCEAPGGWSGTFGPGGLILFSSRIGPISRVPSGGGRPEAATQLETGETNHRWPVVLPDGRTLLFESLDASGKSRIRAQQLDTVRAKTLVAEGQYPRIVPDGHLLFVVPQRDSIFAVRFDAERLEVLGPPVEVAERPFGFGHGDVRREGVQSDLDARRATAHLRIEPGRRRQPLLPTRRRVRSRGAPDHERLRRVARIVVAGRPRSDLRGAAPGHGV